MAQKPPQVSPGAAQALQSAMLALQQGRPEAAEGIARDILARNAGDIGAMYALGHALLQQKRHEDAVAPLERAAQQSRDPAVHTALSVALRQAGRTDDAMSRLKRLVKREPFPPAMVEYGQLLTQSCQYDEARAVFAQGLAIAPSYPDLVVAAAAFFQVVGDFSKAAELYRQLLAADPANARVRIRLGTCQLELGDRESAFENFRAAVKQDRDMVWRVMAAVAQAGHGGLWLDVKDAEAALL